MEKITQHIYLENKYPGVISSVIFLKQGAFLIDAPLRMDDRQLWFSQIDEYNPGGDRLLVLLDAHADRLSSTQFVDFPILTHKNTLKVIPGFAALQSNSSGIEDHKKEAVDLTQNLRWAIPELTYIGEISIEWDNYPVTITHHPGVHPAASWVQYEPEKVVFVGDTVIINQPPFLECCNLDLWIEELNILSSDTYTDYKIIGGRNGVVKQRSILTMIKFLAAVKEIIFELIATENHDLMLADRVNQLLKSLKYAPMFENDYKNRLMRGLNQLLFRYEKGEIDLEGVRDASC